MAVTTEETLEGGSKTTTYSYTATLACGCRFGADMVAALTDDPALRETLTDQKYHHYQVCQHTPKVEGEEIDVECGCAEKGNGTFTRTGATV